MKLLKILALLGLAGVAYGASSNAPAGNYILNVSTFGAQQAINITSATVRQQLRLSYATANQCLQTDIERNVVSAACVSGGGGGTSTLAINQNGIAITSPTIALNALSPPFIIASVGAGATAQWTLDPSSVTLMGNGVNGASQLVQTTFAGALPAISAVNLTNIPSANLSGPVPVANLANAILNQNSLQSGGTLYVSSGTVDGYFRINNPTVAGTTSQQVLFTNLGNQAGYVRQDNFNGICSDLSTTCQNSAIEIGGTGSTSHYLNSDGRLFVAPTGYRQNAYSSVVGGSLIVGGTGNKNYTDTQRIGDGNLLVNNGIIASTMSLTGPGDGKETLTIGISTYTVTYTSTPFTVGQCVVATSTSGALAGITCASGTGGGGSGSSLAVTAGVSRSSPTSDLMLNPQQFRGTVSGSTITISLGIDGTGNSVLINSSNTTVTGASNIVLGDKNNASGVFLTNGSNNTCIGGLSCTNLWSDSSVTAVGANALKVASATTNNSAFGSGALIANTSGISNTAIGKNALVRNISGGQNTALGQGACDNAGFASSTTLSGSICIGDSSYVDASHTMSIGSTHNQFPVNQPLTDIYWNGRQNDTGFAGSSITWHAQASSGTNLAGGDLRIAAGQGSGTGAGGSIFLQAAPVGATGAALNALQTVATIAAGSVTVSGNLVTSGGLYLSSFTASGTGGRINANYTSGPTDSVIFASSTAGGITVTLVSAAAAPGQVLQILKVDSTTNTVRIIPTSTDLIAGTTRQVLLNSISQSAELISDGIGWWPHGQGIQITPHAISAVTNVGGTALIGVSSSVYTCAVTIPVPVTLVGFRYGPNAMAAPAQVAFGLYDFAGNLVASTGPVNGSTTLVGGVVLLGVGNHVNVAAGQYYIATQGSNTAISMAGGTNSTTGPFCEVTASSSMGMPATVTVSGGSGTGRIFSTTLLVNGGRTTE